MHNDVPTTIVGGGRIDEEPQGLGEVPALLASAGHIEVAKIIMYHSLPLACPPPATTAENGTVCRLGRYVDASFFVTVHSLQSLYHPYYSTRAQCPLFAQQVFCSWN